ncbi:ATPase [Candidatus Acidianus copahuensis]|uniref:ATPase n=1 Tax=Candidatus Acidianus copahuensis TaxID=1160895 RepID=A0A031LW55_9CREN|nr:ATP-binding protein [Candidatus Acidianus copahuensis]EZQ11388.1 ATPase [Candidatus Acidianus copahuensis]
MWFIYGPPTDTPFGREDDIRKVTLYMRRGQPLSLIGPRRIGKTSILLASIKQLNYPSVIVNAEEFVENEKGFDLHSFVSYTLESVMAEAYERAGKGHRLKEIVKKSMRSLREMLGAIKVSFSIPEINSRIELFLDKAEKGSKIGEEFSEVLDIPEILCEELGFERFIVIIDEFQYLRLAKQSMPELFHKMRSRWQFHKRVSYVISGSAVGMLEEIMSSKNEPFYQFFLIERVYPFTRDVSIEFLRKGFEVERVKYDLKNIDKIVDYVDGFPAWLNLIGIKVVMRGSTENIESFLITLLEDDNVRIAIDRDLGKLKPSAKSVLKKIAQLGGSAKVKDVVEDKRWKANEALEQLRRYGYIERKEKGVYSILDPMVVHYLSH